MLVPFKARFQESGTSSLPKNAWPELTKVTPKMQKERCQQKFFPIYMFLLFRNIHCMPWLNTIQLYRIYPNIIPGNFRSMFVYQMDPDGTFQFSNSFRSLRNGSGNLEVEKKLWDDDSCHMPIITLLKAMWSMWSYDIAVMFCNGKLPYESQVLSGQISNWLCFPDWTKSRTNWISQPLDGRLSAAASLPAAKCCDC